MNKPLDAIVLRYVGYALLFGLFAYLLASVSGVLPIFAVALLLAYAFEPLLRRMESGGRSRGAAVGFIAVMFMLLMAVLISLLAAAWQQAQELSTNFPRLQQQAMVLIEQNRDRIDHLPVPENVKLSINQGVQDFQGRVPTIVGARLQAILAWIVGSLGTIGIAMIVVPILTLYFMLEMNPLRARALMIVPANYRRDVIEIADSINELLGRYVRGQMIVCGTFGALCMATFYVLSKKYGMEYPIILGMCAAFLYIIPYVGMLLIAASAGATAYFTAETTPVTCAAIAVGCCVLFNLVIDYGVSPRVLGKGVGLHPILVIFALLSGAQIGGIPGMILAVPAFASLRVILIYLFPQLTAPLPQDTLFTGPAQYQAATDSRKANEQAPTRHGVFAWIKRGKRDELHSRPVETAPPSAEPEPSRAK
jgi:predicted PurR-regulated permease PerM